MRSAALVAPLAHAPVGPARVAWYAINLLFIGGLRYWGWRAAGGAAAGWSTPISTGSTRTRPRP